MYKNLRKCASKNEDIEEEPLIKKRREMEEEVDVEVAEAKPRGSRGRKRAVGVKNVKEEVQAPDSNTKGRCRRKKVANMKEEAMVTVKKEDEEKDILTERETEEDEAESTLKNLGKCASKNEDIEEEPLIKKRREIKEEEEEVDVEVAEAKPRGSRGRKRAAGVKNVKEEVQASDSNTEGRCRRKKVAIMKEEAMVTVKKEDEENDILTEKKVEKDEAESTLKNLGRKQTKGRCVKKQKGKENTDSNIPSSKPSQKSGVERVLVMKGSAAVDAVCPLATQSHVYEEQGNVWDCMLNQTNIQFNNNKFYLIQLLKDDKKEVYSVWMRWGRVGATGQKALHPCGSDLCKAKDIFKKKFSDKTRNEWEQRSEFEKVPNKYDLVSIDYSKDQDTTDSIAATKKAKEQQKKVESKLEMQVRALIELICNVRVMEEAVVEMKYDPKRAPLGKLTTEQIKAGYLALKDIDELIREGNPRNKDLVQACNDFYTRIPHYFGMKVPPLIRTTQEIQEKMALLEALGDIQAALKVLGGPVESDVHPVDQQYLSLKCCITPLDRLSSDFEILNRYMKSTHGTTHNQYSLTLEEAFTCHKDTEHQRFRDVGNRLLLWHGSRMSNWAGILSTGLRIAPPEAPVTGYMFGKGIYFADMVSKSANYCWPTKNSNIGFLVLCEVALGKSNELVMANEKADKLPKNCHSVKGRGMTSPTATELLSDGTKLPMGPCAKVPKSDKTRYSLLYNEYIVYDPSQVLTRFLVKVKFHFK